jgi:hypothetical protein
MKPGESGPTDGAPSLRNRLARAMAGYVCVGGLFIGVVYAITPESVWSAIAPILGGLIGLLILSTPPVRRWLERLRRNQ